MPSSPSPDSTAQGFASRLLEWWDDHGRKDLPWQEPRTPYRVWISEVMLQQTQVTTVIDYFERWMAKFPGLPDLANASQDEVMGLWSGLGYYSRARNIHKAAKICMECFDGHMPETPHALTELPGIGQSTANAIVSLAHNRPAAILDGNVKRLLARHAGIGGWPGESKVQRQLWKEAESRLPAERAADYSQAVMDLGAMVCTRNKPGCARCPVSGDCIAFISGTTDQIPAPRPKNNVPTRKLLMVIFRDKNGRVLLERRPPNGIWGGLWSLPEDNEDTRRDGETLPTLEHRLTHLHLLIKPRLVTITDASKLECSGIGENSRMDWFAKGDWERLGLPRPVSILLEQLEQNTTT